MKKAKNKMTKEQLELIRLSRGFGTSTKAMNLAWELVLNYKQPERRAFEMTSNKEPLTASHNQSDAVQLQYSMVPSIMNEREIVIGAYQLLFPNQMPTEDEYKLWLNGLKELQQQLVSSSANVETVKEDLK